MTTSSAARVDALFHDALDLKPSDRAAFLARICEGDSFLRAEIESLLAAHDAAAAFLEDPAVSCATFDRVRDGLSRDRFLEESLAPGTVVGRYRIVGLIASGGMGAVYRAVRADDAFDQQVAIKLIRRSMMTESMRRRFHRERQTLARLEHPSITRLIDGGTTGAGVPYLVMECVEGVPIDAYCDERRLDIRARLELFRSVCEAVYFAHQNLTVHRDLKPRNILVTPSGRPKLLDFGIAALIDEDTDAAAGDATVTALRALTPRYASPEQVRGERVTTATDVYSLGIVLYELLTGHRVYALDGTSVAEAERIVCEQVPLAPSEVVTRGGGVAPGAQSNSERDYDSHSRDIRNAGSAGASPSPCHRIENNDRIAALRGVQAQDLRRHLRGDLDNIILTALAKEPSRRYASVWHFSEDIRCFLDGRPVAARRDTVPYRVAKWVRRNRGIAVAGAVALLAMFLGTVGATMGLIKARRAEHTAQLERNAAVQSQEEAQAVTHFLQDVLAAANPYRRARDVTVEELLSEASKRIPFELAGRPAVEAGVRLAIARTYAGMWSWAEAIPHLRAALPMFREIRGDRHPDVASCLSLLGRALTFARDSESLVMQREALDIRREAFGAEHPLVAESWGNLAYAQWHGVAKPNWYAAELNYRRAIDMYQRTAPDDLSNRARFTFSLGVMLAAIGREPESASLLSEALEIYRSMPITEDRYVLECMKRYAFVLVRLGRFEKAEAIMREAALMTPDVSGSPDGDAWLWDQGRLFCERGDLDRAEAMYRGVLVGMCDRLAQAKPELADQLSRFIEQLTPAGTDDAPDPDYLPIIATLDAYDGQEARANSFRAFDLAVLECNKGRHERALPIFDRCHDLMTQQAPQAAWSLAKVRLAHGECLLHVGDRARAEPLLREARDTLIAVFGADHRLSARAVEAMRSLHNDQPLAADQATPEMRAEPTDPLVP